MAIARRSSSTAGTKQRTRRREDVDPDIGLDVNDPWTWAITPDMTCAVEDMPPMTGDDCAAVARILDELHLLQARHRAAGRHVN